MAGDVQRLRSCFTSLGKKERRQRRLFPGLTVTALVRWTGRGVWKRGMTFCRSSFSRSQECSMVLPVCLDNAGDRCRSTGRDEFPWWAVMPGDADERRFQCVLSHVHYPPRLPWQEVLYLLLRDWLANVHWIHEHGSWIRSSEFLYWESLKVWENDGSIAFVVYCKFWLILAATWFCQNLTESEWQ